MRVQGFSKTIFTWSYQVLCGRTEHFISIRVWVLWQLINIQVPFWEGSELRKSWYFQGIPCFMLEASTLICSGLHAPRYFVWSYNFFSAPTLTAIYKLSLCTYLLLHMNLTLLQHKRCAMNKTGTYKQHHSPYTLYTTMYMVWATFIKSGILQW